MFKRPIYILLFLLASISMAYGSGGSGKPSGGIKFIENNNQWHSSIHYSAHLPSGNLYLKNNSLQFFLYDKNAVAELHMKSHDQVYESGEEVCDDELEIGMHQYLVNFINSSNDVVMSGNEVFPEYYNYYLGNDPSKWASHAKAYQTVNYEGLYDGIDMRVYSSGVDLKYDLIIKPGAVSSDIALQYEGLNDLYIYDDDLIIETSLGMVREQKPYAYQVIEGVEVPVECNYILDCERLSFGFPNGYNEAYEVVIDPLLIFSTYSGSPADNWGNTATPGEHGKLYSGGITNHFRGFDSSGQPIFLGEFPATPNAFQTTWGGIWDVAIIKYDSSGSEVEYATYLGGSGSEVPHSMIMDNNENLIIMGSTNSTDFPVTSNAYQTDFQGGTTIGTILGQTFVNGSDIFIVKLSSDGSALKGGTYFGGDGNDGQNRTGSPLVKNYGDEQRGEVFVDDNNKIYIASVTSSEGLFDDTNIASFDRSYNNGSSDGIVVKFASDLEEVIWGSYLGGENDDAALALKINSMGQVYVAGGTDSPDMTTTPGVLHETIQGEEDGFVALVSKDGSQLLNATYLGTSSYDQVYFIDIDENEDVYVLGQTRGGYPVTSGVYSNSGGGQFIHKLNPDLSMTIFSTAFGTVNRNEPNISLTAFLVSECDNMYVTGWGNTQGNFTGNGYVSLSTQGLPTTSDAIRTTTNGDDFYLMVLDTDATELLYATFFGGSTALVHVDGGTSRFDKRGIVYHSVCASCFGDSSFPTTEGAWSNVNASGSGCNNAAFKFDLASLRARIQSNSVGFDNPGVTAFCFPEPVVFENVSIGGETFQWNFGDGTNEQKSDTSHIVHEYQSPGIYVVTLTAIDQNTCLGVDVAKLTIGVYQSNFSVVDDGDICQGTEYELSAFGGTSYTWFDSDSSFLSFEQFPVVMPDDTTKYYVHIVEENKNCERLDSVVVNVIPAVSVDVEAVRNYDCTDVPTVAFVNRTENASEYAWTFGDGASSNEMMPTHDYDSGIYQLTLRATHEICSDEKTITVNAQPIKAYNVITPGTIDGANDVFTVQSPFPIHLTMVNRWGKVVFESEEYQNNWKAEGEPAGIYYYDMAIDGDQVCKGWVQVLK